LNFFKYYGSWGAVSNGLDVSHIIYPKKENDSGIKIPLEVWLYEHVRSPVWSGNQVENSAEVVVLVQNLPTCDQLRIKEIRLCNNKYGCDNHTPQLTP